MTLAVWLAVRSRLTELPESVGWRHIYGAGWLAGIDFTMALFAANLAFAEEGEEAHVTAAKQRNLVATVIAGAGDG